MATITWKDAGHKQRFLATMQEIGKIDSDGSMDTDYGAAVYILTANKHTWDMAKAVVHNHSINFDGLLTGGHLTSGSYIMNYLAANLFNGETPSSPYEISGHSLDESNYQTAISAFHIKRYGLRVDELK